MPNKTIPIIPAEYHTPPTPEQWALLEEMRPHFCCLTLDSDFNYVWDVRGVLEGGDDHERIWLSGSYSHNTVGEAIEAAYKFWKENLVVTVE